MISLFNMLLETILTMKYKERKQIKELEISKRFLLNIGYHWFEYDPSTVFNHEYAWIKRKNTYYDI